MSIKHRVKDRSTNGKMRPLFFGWDYRWHAEHTAYFVDYSKNRSAWNRVMNNRPKRKESRVLCRQITTGDRDAEAAMFPLNRKPNSYEW
ncbi:TPA: hypothetical protein QH074_004318 [Enterobacter hormaechei subsp. steigerwaltii]|nr:hypothetical protein [Enterobacter hormaechei subsp. steigerwaltii]